MKTINRALLQVKNKMFKIIVKTYGEIVAQEHLSTDVIYRAITTPQVDLVFPITTLIRNHCGGRLLS
jgi:hypothetical protein